MVIGWKNKRNIEIEHELYNNFFDFVYKKAKSNMRVLNLLDINLAKMKGVQRDEKMYFSMAGAGNRRRAV